MLTWALQAVVGRVLGPASFASFMTIWGLLFFLLAFLQGIQQEIVRATSVHGDAGLSRSQPPAGSVAPRWWMGAIAVLLVAAIGIFLVLTAALPDDPVALLTAALVVGLPCLVMHQVFNGLLAGRQMWGYYATSLTAEAMTRFALVSGVVALGAGIVAQTWALVFGGLGWLLLVFSSRVRSALTSVRHLDPGSVTRNATRSLVATASSALLINAFPVLLQIAGGDDASASAETGVVIAAVVLTRAPLLMPLFALQGLIIGAFTRHRSRVPRLLVRGLGAIAILTLLGCVLGALVGPAVLELVFGPEYVVDGGPLAALIAGAGTTAALTLAGWAAMAAGRLHLYAIAWLLAPVVATFVLTLDLPITVGAAAALIVGPLAGLGALACGVAFRRAPRDEARQPAARAGQGRL